MSNDYNKKAKKAALAPILLIIICVALLLWAKG